MRGRGTRPAEVVLDCGKDRALDPSSLRIFRADATGQPSPASEESLPFRWYDDAIPYDNLELVGIRAAFLTHRPVAAIDDAVFAEALDHFVSMNDAFCKDSGYLNTVLLKEGEAMTLYYAT